MANVKEDPEHRARRLAVRALEKQIANLETIRFEPAQLQQLKIRTLPMSFRENGELDFKPCFFKPYPADLLVSPDADDVPSFPEHGRELTFHGHDETDRLRTGCVALPL